MRRSLLLFACTLLALLSLGVSWTPQEAAQAQQVNIPYRFLNLTDAPLDLYRNGEVVFFGITPTALSSERVLTELEDSAFAVYAENATPANSTPLTDAQFSLSKPATLVAYTNADGGVSLYLYEPDTTPTVTHRGRLEVVHLASTLPDVAVIAQNGDVLIESAPYEAVTIADVPGGNYQLNLTEAGNPENILSTATLDANAAGDALARHTALLLYRSEDRLRSLPLTATIPQQALFRFVHAGRISPILDVYFDETRVFSGVGYQAVTPYAPIDPGTYAVSLVESGTSNAPLWTGNVTLTTNLPLTGVALGDNNFRLLTYADDLQLIPADGARVRFINAALNLPLLTVTDSSAGTLVGGLEYALGSPNQSLATGARTLTYSETGGDVYITQEDIMFDPNTTYTFIIIGNTLIDEGVEVLILTWRWNAP